MAPVTPKLEFVFRIRMELGIRQKDIVERTGFSQGRVSHICLGRIKSVESHSLFALADALQCDARWLATGEDE